METNRDDVRRWLREIMATTGDTPSSLARRAGLATTTLTRFMHTDDSPMLSMRTLAKISHATGVDPFRSLAETPEASPLPVGLHDEAVRYTAPSTDDRIEQAVQALSNNHATDPWVLRSDALQLAGFVSGDILIIDLNATPGPGDVVCAQIYQWDRRSAETIFRLFEPPYLVTASAKHFGRPLLVDNNTVVVKGVATAMLRPLRKD